MKRRINDKNERKSLIRVVYILLVILSLMILAFSVYKIFFWKLDNDNIDSIDKEIKTNTKIEEKEPVMENTENVNPPEEDQKENYYWDYIKMDMLNVDFKDLKNKNSDTVGWIKVNGTTINYPIVQTTNNSYYLNHAFDKSKNDAGWIFADYRNNMTEFDKNTIIYGHGRIKLTMFGSLKKILNNEWYNNKDNHIIKLSNPTENTLWQVFSIYVIKEESYYITTKFSNDEAYNKFLQTIRGRSKFEFNTDLSTTDKILTLSTCNDNLGNRIVMHAKLIKKEVR